MGRGQGNLSYRLTQVLTGHAVFDSYLARIGREETAECWFCGTPEDDVEHTVTTCPTWDELRQRLVEVIGPDLSIRGLVNGLLRGFREWSAISQFSEAVLRTKEDREGEREKSRVRHRMLRKIRRKKKGGDEEEVNARSYAEYGDELTFVAGKSSFFLFLSFLGGSTIPVDPSSVFSQHFQLPLVLEDAIN